MRKVLLLVLLFLNLSVLPSWSAENVIIDRITAAEAEELDIQIPDDVPPGFHSVEIEVYDDGGTLSTQEIVFCKNLSGEVRWDNQCPDVTELWAYEDLMKIAEREELPAYSPAQEPEKSKDLAVAAFAALAALTVAGAAKDKESRDSEDQPEGEDKEQEDLASVDSGKIALIKRDPGRGDRSRTWQNPFTNESDHLFVAAAFKASGYSPLLARTLADGSYLRAILGSFAAFLYPIAVILGVAALINVGAQAMAPALGIILAIVVIGILDAFAGFIAAAIFFLGVFITGHMGTRHELLTVAGLMVIFFAPALLASAVRPLRRLVSNGEEGWERITDYALAILLTGWAVEKMVNALNGLASVAIWSAVLVGIRIALEDVSTYHYPVRLQTVTAELQDPDQYQKIISLMIKTFIFVMLAAPFVGFNIQLILGTALFVFPSIASMTFAKKLPKFPNIHWLIPKGAFKIVAMVFVGFVFANWVQGQFSNPQTFLKWSFVILTFPGIFFAILGWIAKAPEKSWRENRNGQIAYRILGVLVFLLVVQIVRGVDLTSWL
jgi:uncharacterized membrane protein